MVNGTNTESLLWKRRTQWGGKIPSLSTLLLFQTEMEWEDLEQSSTFRETLLLRSQGSAVYLKRVPESPLGNAMRNIRVAPGVSKWQGEDCYILFLLKILLNSEFVSFAIREARQGGASQIAYIIYLSSLSKPWEHSARLAQKGLWNASGVRLIETYHCFIASSWLF